MNLSSLFGGPELNIRNGEGWDNGEGRFRMLDLQGNQIGDFFSIKELTAKLDELKTSKGSAFIQSECPHIGSDQPCSEDWHEFSLTFEGKEFIYHFLTYKLVEVGMTWYDPNDNKRKADQGGGGDVAAQGSASVDTDAVHSTDGNNG